MRAGKGAEWVTLHRIVDGKLVIIHEPLRDYQLHNLLKKGWVKADAS